VPCGFGAFKEMEVAVKLLYVFFFLLSLLDAHKQGTQEMY